MNSVMYNKNGNVKDRTGVSVNGVTFIEFAHIRNNKAHWKLKCHCGKEFIASAKNICNGNTKSCGCIQKENARKARSLPHGISAFNQTLASYRNGAIKRGLEFNLSKDCFRSITQQVCFYCGVEPIQTSYTHKKYNTGGYLHNGIDRVDNKKGYVIGNIVPCCRNCNTMKMGLNINDFFNQVKRIYERHIKDV